ncbi:MAG: ABC transporter permease [Hyphomicrobiales bacterium]|nr:ABC transporter permease [Hyphomicrobiales bacterium]
MTASDITGPVKSNGLASRLVALMGARFWWMMLGYVSFVGLWQASVMWLPIEAFQRLPHPLEVIVEWFNPDPDYGISIFTEDYYTHIFYSTYRALTSFFLACLLGIPLGIVMGWKVPVREYASTIIGILRPIPPLAWVPLAILVFPGVEPSVIFVTFLVAFFATTINSLLGVRAIHEDYFRAAECLGASQIDTLRDVIIPGAMPSIFTGLQIAMGAAWFSLVAGEMIAAQFGLGFLIWEAYNLIQYPTIIIGMATLGMVGYASSALIRVVGNRLMRWRLESIGVMK